MRTEKHPFLLLIYFLNVWHNIFQKVSKINKPNETFCDRTTKVETSLALKNLQKNLGLELNDQS